MFRKPIRIFLPLFLLIALVWTLASIPGGSPAVPSASPPLSAAPQSPMRAEDAKIAYHRDISDVSFQDVTYTPWDVERAEALAGVQPVREHTILIYMNGSDLESESGAATGDLSEMLSSGVDTETVNVVIFTGGTNRWRNDVIPSGECALWRIGDSGLIEIAGLGKLNMGDPGTLAGFIEFGRNCFPAPSCSLIFWDHGGGSIAGFGHDENFQNGRLSLLAMNYAFEQAGLAERPLELIGYDACLMATVEMGVIASRYARYLVASEDLEPGDGWNYSFLSELGGGSAVDGAQLGKAIVNSYFEYYGEDTPENLTLSVTDLNEVGGVMGAMGVLSARASGQIALERPEAFDDLAQRRRATKSFGGGSPRDGVCDMVDVGQMALMLSDLFPTEAQNVLDALDLAVIYNGYDCDTDVYGLAAYYLYGDKENAVTALGVYEALCMSPDYTGYLHAFAEALTGDQPQSSGRTDVSSRASYTLWKPVPGQKDRLYLAGLLADGGAELSFPPEGALWPHVREEPLCLYEAYRCDEGVAYAAPVSLNGHGADLIVLVPHGREEGVLLGARRQDGYLLQKGLETLKEGDRITPQYETAARDGTRDRDRWRSGAEIVWGADEQIAWRLAPAGKGCVYGIREEDARGDIMDTLRS